MEERRLEAGRLFEEGCRSAEVARRMGVSTASVCRWRAAWERAGAQGLKIQRPNGRQARLSDAQVKEVEQALLLGPIANGFSTELWTMARVAEVIERLTGVSYHPHHIWWLLRRMGWTRQKPARQAVERNEEAISNWVKEEWPRIKKAPAGSGHGSSSRTRAGSR